MEKRFPKESRGGKAIVSKREIGQCLGEIVHWASQVVLVLKKPLADAGYIRDVNLIPGLGRSSGGGHGNPFYSCPENPWTEESGGLQFMGPQRVGHDLSDLACMNHSPLP